MVKQLIIKDKNNFAELIEKISVHNMISMEVPTGEGSYLEGINWDYLKYVYNKEKDTENSSVWIDYTIVYQDPGSPDSLLSDFDEILSNAVHANPMVTVIYDEEV